MKEKLSVAALDVKGKRVLVRVDFNVPLKEGKVADDTRIRESLPTIKSILERGGSAVLVSHLGRPKGVDEKLRMDPVARRLGELLGRPVKKLNDCIGPEVEQAVRALKPGEAVLLENVRFHPEEEKGDAAFAAKLAALADLFVNDAFGTCHRAHASVAGVAKHLRAAAGFLVQKEIKYLIGAVANPARPLLAILGGAKVSDKIPLVKNLLAKVDSLVIGGGMAYTFLKAQGAEIGESLLEAERLGEAKAILAQAKKMKKKVLLPVDHVVAGKVEAGARAQVVTGNIPAGLKGVDIGPKTIDLLRKEIARAKTILWNGPLGVFEIDAFAAGTKAAAEAIAASGAVSILGGGDSAAAAVKFGVAGKMTHVSTGGGASLELLGGDELPGIAALADAK